MRKNRKTGKLLIASVGDIALGGGYARRPELFTTWIDDRVRDFLRADVTIANMEYVLLPDGESWPGGLCLAAPMETLKALRHAGFNVLTLANNHIFDFERERGMLATMKALDEVGIKHCGAGMNLERARSPAIIDIHGKKVAVLSRLHDYSFINVKPITATDNSSGVALLEEDEIRESIRNCRRNEQADVVVLCLHWGMQNLHDHSLAVHKLGEKLLEAGADLVLGSHSHVLQGLSRHQGKYCFYGQGNFYFYPYPLAGQPGGLLYGPDAVRHRIAAASKFSWDGQKWRSEILVTFQHPKDETVVPLPEPDQHRFRRKIEKSWSRWRPLIFHAVWRIEVLRRLVNQFAGMLMNRRFKGAGWYFNPVNWIKEMVNPRSLG